MDESYILPWTCGGGWILCGDGESYRYYVNGVLLDPPTQFYISLAYALHGKP